MKFIDLNGKWHLFNFNKICKENSSPSNLHIEARKLIKATFPYSSIYEEVSLLGTGLIADFFISDIKVLIEINGEQHYKFVKRFHKTQAGFAASKKRDRIKQEWCDLNDIIYVEFPFNKKDEWANILGSIL